MYDRRSVQEYKSRVVSILNYSFRTNHLTRKRIFRQRDTVYSKLYKLFNAQIWDSEALQVFVIAIALQGWGFDINRDGIWRGGPFESSG